MKASDLQFKNPRLIEVEYLVNKEYSFEENKPINLDLEFKVNVNKKDNQEAIVELTVIVGAKEEKNPFYIKVTEGARFRWSDDLKGSEKKLLEINAPAILLGYIRPIVAMMTSSLPFGAYNIPLIDFTK